jgi:DNA polymerase-1
MTKLHMIQLGTVDGDDVTIYADHPGCEPLADGVRRIEAAEKVVFHNGICFDEDAINKFYPGLIGYPKMLDTLVMARLADPEERNHTLKAHGLRMGVHKGEYKGDFKEIDAELLAYAPQDIVVGRALYRKVRHVETWGSSCDLEHRVAYAIRDQERYGFYFDTKKAEALELRLRAEADEVRKELQRVFPPIQRETTRIMQASNKKFGYVKGQPHTKTWMETYNPASRQQTAARLQALGWKPKKFGADGIASVDEAVLSAMKHPVAQPLLKSFVIGKKLGMLSDGKAGWLKMVQPDSRIHGRVNSNGTRTGRMTHSKPNTAQVDKDHEMRELWCAAPGMRIVGCDGEGIQLRVLSHYLHRYDGGKLAERIVSGKKSERSDPHSANLQALTEARVLPPILWTEEKLPNGQAGFGVGRDGAKTCIYAKIFGSTDAGLGRTISGIYRDAALAPPRVPLMELGRAANVALSRSMTGLDKLEATAQSRLKAHGYIIGLDGRRLYSKQARLALVTLCQGGEAVIMKTALNIFHYEKAPAAGWRIFKDYGYVANVHDEVQIETIPEIAEAVGAAFAACVAEAAPRLNFKCQLAGLAQIGLNWAETH